MAVGHRGPGVLQGEHHLIVDAVQRLYKEPAGGGHAQAPALAHGVPVDAAVAAQHPAGFIHKVPGGAAEAPGLQEGGVVILRDEADLHAVGALRGGQAPLGGGGPDGSKQ